MTELGKLLKAIRDGEIDFASDIYTPDEIARKIEKWRSSRLEFEVPEP